MDKSCHLVATWQQLSYFGQRWPEPYLNEWGESCKFTLSGHWDIKTLIESAVNSDKNRLKSSVTLTQNKI